MYMYTLKTKEAKKETIITTTRNKKYIKIHTDQQIRTQYKHLFIIIMIIMQYYYIDYSYFDYIFYYCCYFFRIKCVEYTYMYRVLNPKASHFNPHTLCIVLSLHSSYPVKLSHYYQYYQLYIPVSTPLLRHTPSALLSTHSLLTASSLAHLYVQFLSRCPIFQRRRDRLRTLPHMPALSCLLQKTTQENNTDEQPNFKSVSLKCEYGWIYLLVKHDVKQVM